MYGSSKTFDPLPCAVRSVMPSKSTADIPTDLGTGNICILTPSRLRNPRITESDWDSVVLNSWFNCRT